MDTSHDQAVRSKLCAKHNRVVAGAVDDHAYVLSIPNPNRGLRLQRFGGSAVIFRSAKTRPEMYWPKSDVCASSFGQQKRVLFRQSTFEEEPVRCHLQK